MVLSWFIRYAHLRKKKKEQLVIEADRNRRVLRIVSPGIMIAGSFGRLQKLKRKPHSEWLPEWARAPGIYRVGPANKIFVFGHMIKFGYSSVKIAGYWPCFSFFDFDFDFASVNKNAQKRLVNNAYLLSLNVTTLRPDKGFICNVTTFRAKHTKHTQARAVARFFVTGGKGVGALSRHTCTSLVWGSGGVLPPQDFQIWRL